MAGESRQELRCLTMGFPCSQAEAPKRDEKEVVVEVVKPFHRRRYVFNR